MVTLFNLSSNDTSGARIVISTTQPSLTLNTTVSPSPATNITISYWQRSVLLGRGVQLPISFAPGQVSMEIIALIQDGNQCSGASAYVIEISRQSFAQLASLSVFSTSVPGISYTLTPAFTPNITSYSLALPPNTASIILQPVASNSSSSTVKIGTQTISSGTNTTVSVSNGASMSVTAYDLKDCATLVYTITISMPSPTPPAVVAAVPANIAYSPTANTTFAISLASLSNLLPTPHTISFARPGQCNTSRVGGEYTVTTEVNLLTLPPMPAAPVLHVCYRLGTNTTGDPTWYELSSPTLSVYQAGNGVIEPPELCDDGNVNSGDGCNPSGIIEPTYSCSNSSLTPSSPSVCSSCGNKKLELPETCDDGNTISNDGCSANCTVEVATGFSCTLSATGASQCGICGNGKVEPPEACDDGNTTSGDGCSSLCTIEPKATCLYSSTAPSQCYTCGDGVFEKGEGCDDNNTLSNDGCSATCFPEPGYSCSGVNPSRCQRCGNGKIEGTELCDDGNTFSNDGCSSSCSPEVGFQCGSVGQPCTRFGCGDGVPSCTEECDDFNNIAGDGCDGICRREPGYQCSGAPSRCQKCGNGRVEGNEVCDDGNINPGDGCTPGCALEPGFLCVPDSFVLATPKSICLAQTGARVSRAFPLSGPLPGGTPVMIVGIGLGSSTFTCIFGSTPSQSVPAVPDSTTVPTVPGALRCMSPLIPSTTSTSSSTLKVTLAVVDSVSGTTLPSEVALSFTYFVQPTVVLVSPTSSFTAGQIDITVVCLGLPNATLLNTNSSSSSSSAFAPAIILRAAAPLPTPLRVALASTNSNETSVVLPARVDPSGSALVAKVPFHLPAVFDVVVSLHYFEGVAFSTTASSSGSAPSPSTTFTYKLCDPGYVAKAVDQPCVPCAPGTFSLGQDQRECSRCLRSFAPLNASSACTPCPTGTDTSLSAEPPASLTSCQCSEGFYHSQGLAGVECSPCKRGGMCAGSKEQPVPKPGFWAESTDAAFVRCDRDDESVCPGKGFRVCGKGYEGVRCGDCVDGYYRLQSLCVPCPRQKSSRFYAFGAAMIIITVLAVLLSRGGKRKQLLTTFTLGSNFFQVLGIVLSMDLRWPGRVTETVGLITLPANFNTDLMATECTVKFGFDGKWFTTLLMPFAFVSLLLLMYIGMSIVNLFRFKYRGGAERAVRAAIETWKDVSSASPGIKRQRLAHAIINAFFLLISLLYIILSSAALSLFDCSVQGDSGEYFLDAVPSQRCFDAWWWRRFPFALAGIVLYVLGIPALVLSTVLYSKSRMTSDAFGRRFGAISGKYKPGYEWWEPVVMLRKLGVVLSKIMFTSIPLLQALGALSVIVASMALHIQFHPMIEKRSNLLESVLLTCSAAVLLSGILLSGTSFEGFRHKAVVAFVLVVVTAAIAVLLYVVVAEVWGNLWREKRGVKTAPTEELFEQLILPRRIPLLQQWLQDPEVLTDDKQAFREVILSYDEGLGKDKTRTDDLLDGGEGSTQGSKKVKRVEANPLAVEQAAMLLAGPVGRLGRGWLHEDKEGEVCRWLVRTTPVTRTRFAHILAALGKYSALKEWASPFGPLHRAPGSDDQASNSVHPQAVDLANGVLLDVFVPTLHGDTRTPLSSIVMALLPPDQESVSGASGSGGAAAASGEPELTAKDYRDLQVALESVREEVGIAPAHIVGSHRGSRNPAGREPHDDSTTLDDEEGGHERGNEGRGRGHNGGGGIFDAVSPRQFLERLGAGIFGPFGSSQMGDAASEYEDPGAISQEDDVPSWPLGASRRQSGRGGREVDAATDDDETTTLGSE